MALFIIILFILIEIILITLFIRLNKIKKSIWQKISFLYNKIYQVLILVYYNSNNISLKLEIIDYYNNIVINNNVVIKNQKWKKFEKFIINYFSKNKKICDIFKDIKKNVDNDYAIINNAIHNIIYSMVIIIILLIGILYIVN